MGGQAHVLGTAADHDVSVAGQNGTGAFDQGLHAGTADHADGVSGNGIGDTGLDSHLTGNVLAQTGGQHAAEHHFINSLGGDVGAVQGFLDHDGTQIHSGGVLQGTAKGTNGSSAAIDDVQIFHEYFLLQNCVLLSKTAVVFRHS